MLLAGVYTSLSSPILLLQNLTIRGQVLQPMSNDTGDTQTRGYDAIIDCEATNGPALRIRGSGYTLVDLEIRNCFSNGDAGAVLVTGPQSTLTCRRTMFYNNSALSDNGGGGGGAILSEGKVIVEDSLFWFNSAEQHGGAISAHSIVVSDSFFTQNRIFYSMSRGGGALYADSELVAIRSNFTSNAAGLSGGGAIYSNKVLIDSCRFDHNHAGEGGAIDSRPASSKRTSALQPTSDQAALSVHHSTFSNNIALRGGAIISRNHAALYHSVFDSNTAREGAAVWANGNLLAQGGQYSNNSAAQGGAFYLDQSSDSSDSGTALYRVQGVSFTSNSAVAGAALFFQAISEEPNATTISDSHFSLNYASIGGAVYVIHEIALTNCTFEKNSALCKGGAVIMPISLLDEAQCIANNKQQAARVFEPWFSTLDANSNDVHRALVQSIERVTADDYDYRLLVPTLQKDGIINATRCNFVSNWVESAAVVAVSNAAGGAMFGPVSLQSCTFSNNSAEAYGGAIFGTLSVELKDCNFTLNRAAGSGGAIGSLTAAVQVVGSYFEGNSARMGGAILAPTVRLSDSQLIQNTAATGGAIYATKIFSGDHSYFRLNAASSNQSTITSGKGGAVFVEPSAALECSFCNFVLNTAALFGGALCGQGSMTCLDCSFDSNRATAAAGSAWASETATFTRCNFTNSFSNAKGGAIIANGPAAVSQCRFTNNYALVSGGAIDSSLQLTVSNSYFCNNTVGGATGGAIYVDNVVANNCEFVNNTAFTGGAIAGLALHTCTHTHTHTHTQTNTRALCIVIVWLMHLVDMLMLVNSRLFRIIHQLDLHYKSRCLRWCNLWFDPWLDGSIGSAIEYLRPQQCNNRRWCHPLAHMAVDRHYREFAIPRQ
jgi:predicted outer membrane repeat protein